MIESAFDNKKELNKDVDKLLSDKLNKKTWTRKL